jgi:hypothetical protein
MLTVIGKTLVGSPDDVAVNSAQPAPGVYPWTVVLVPTFVIVRLLAAGPAAMPTLPKSNDEGVIVIVPAAAPELPTARMAPSRIPMADFPLCACRT